MSGRVRPGSFLLSVSLADPSLSSAMPVIPPAVSSGPRNRGFVGIAAALLLLLPLGGSAQELTRGSPQIGVRIQLLDQPYLIDGPTGPDVLAQLGALGPGGRWTQFPYVYSWTRTAEQERLPNGSLSSLCSLSAFEIQFDITVRYPRWVAPEGASDRLIEAWAAFSEDLVAYWDQYRDQLLDRAKDMVNRTRFYEEVCSQVDVRLRDLVRQAVGEPDRAEPEEPRLALRWPPPGFEDVMRESTPPLTGAGRAGAGRAGSAATGSAASRVAAGDPAGAPPAPARTSSRGDATFDEALETDFQIHGARELIFGLHHRGELEFREAYGPAERLAAGTLEPDAVFGFAGFTEILIATTASSLAARGLLDFDAPISTYLRTLPSGLGSVTLDQLLTHRAGLDNAMAVNRDDWSAVLDRLGDNALFTEPGSVFSYSRYSYPLAARIIEQATGVELGEALARVVTVPLGLGSTSIAAGGGAGIYDGVPLTLTTLDDVTRFWLAWLDGEVPGAGPATGRGTLDSWPERGSEDFLDGYWRDHVGAFPRIRVMCGAPPNGYASGIQIYPESRTVFVFWGRYEDADPERASDPPTAERWPAESARFVLGRMNELLQFGDAIYGPTRLNGGGELTVAPRRCPEPALSHERVEEFGEPVPAADWPGRYVNGDQQFDLGETDGLLTNLLNPGSSGFDVRHFREDLYFTQMNRGGAEARGFAYQLIRDASGRRYVVIDNRAYVHEEDAGR